MKLAYLLLSSCFLPACSAQNGTASLAPVRPVIQASPDSAPSERTASEPYDIFFGERVSDPYRWLESSKDQKANDWLRAQETLAERTLDTIPGIDTLRQRVQDMLLSNESITDVHFSGNTFFYFRRRPGEEVDALCIRGGDGNERVLFRPVSATSNPVSIAHVSPSPSGRMVAFSIAASGKESFSIHVLETATGKEVGTPVEGAANLGASWISNNESFYYTRFPHFNDGDPKTRYQFAEVLRHNVTKPVTSDEVVIGANVSSSPALALEDIPKIVSAPESDAEIAVIYRGSSDEPRIFARHSARRGSSWLKVIDHEDAVIDWTLDKNNLFFISRRNSPAGNVLAIDIDHPGDPKTLAGAGNGKIVGISVCGETLFVVEQDVYSEHIRRISIRGKQDTDVALPFDTNISDFRSNSTAGAAFFRVEGWSDSPRWIGIDAKSGNISNLFADALTKSIPNQRIEHAEVRSLDGTLVPLTIVSGGTEARSGNAPAMIIGYGAYEESLRPVFAAQRTFWLEHGGVLAMAHVRGGGERGREWHLAGMRERKQNSVDDFVSCARYLISAGYTTSAHLGAFGASAGGIVVGAAFVQQPDLFRAVYLDRGAVDILRWLSVAAGPGNREEFGEPDTEEHFRVLRRLDAYQQVSSTVRYPAVLVAVGLNDSRVPAWQGAKLIAKLQETVPGGGPFLLRTDATAGHYRDTTTQAARAKADVFGFFLWQFGLHPQASDGGQR